MFMDKRGKIMVNLKQLLYLFPDIGSERFRWAGMVRLHIEAFIRIARKHLHFYASECRRVRNSVFFNLPKKESKKFVR